MVILGVEPAFAWARMVSLSPERVMSRVLLASQSPRRRMLLEEVGFEVDVLCADVDESIEGVSPREAAMQIACRKGQAVAPMAAGRGHDFMLAADTMVWTDAGEIFGKPRDRADARRMLGRLLGATHTVTTGFAIWAPGEASPAYVGECSSRVTMQRLSPGALESYLESDEPWDKAGAYGVQGLAGAFISRIEGSWHTVVGLPVHAVIESAQSLGLLVRMPWERTQ